MGERTPDPGDPRAPGRPGLKVHAKICLITRQEGGNLRHYSAVGTGNFNEQTAKLYTDHLLLTSSVEIGRDVESVFDHFESPYRPPKLQLLIPAPFELRLFIQKRIQAEIKAARKKKPAWIFLKLNNLSDVATVKLLYEASVAGVEVSLIIRSMYSPITGIKGLGENIEAIGIVDRYLEHSRIFAFCNGGTPTYHLSSADLLPRNYDNRFEIAVPITDRKIRKELETYMDLQWRDNTKARILDAKLKNRFQKIGEDDEPLRAQEAIAEYLADL